MPAYFRAHSHEIALVSLLWAGCSDAGESAPTTLPPPTTVTLSGSGADSSSSSVSGSSSGFETTGEGTSGGQGSGGSSSGSSGAVEPCGVGGCPPATPYCSEGTCVNCVGAADCALLAGSETPYCDESTGRCVECLAHEDCAEPTPNCDSKAGRCEAPCQEHRECEIGACELDVGRCFPRETLVRHARLLHLGCYAHDCSSREQACCSAQEALASAWSTDPEAPYVIVHIEPHPEEPWYDDKGFLATSRAQRVALIGHEGILFQGTWRNRPQIMSLTPEGEGPSAEAKLFVSGIHVAPGTHIAAAGCERALLWIDDTVIEAFVHEYPYKDPLSGLRAEGCRLVARRTVVRGSDRGVTGLAQGRIELINSIVGGSVEHEIFLEDGAALTGLYATIVRKDAKAGALLHAPKAEVTLRNSLLAAEGDLGGSILKGIFSMTNSAYTSAGLQGTGNRLLSNKISGLFVDWAGDDFHVLGAGTALRDVAVWQDGDPATDLDGDPRPTLSGLPDQAGADRP